MNFITIQNCFWTKLLLYSQKNTIRNSMFLIVYYLIVSALTAKCTDATNQQNCEASSCNVQIGGKTYCSQCNAGFVPIDGTCVEKSGQDTKAKCKKDANGSEADQTCGKCEGATFMFKGGCYTTTANAPGQTMCTQAANGICTVVADGSKYFLPPTGEADNLHQSVIPCGDDSVVTVANQKQYKGVANCLTCTAPASGEANTPKAATCTECATGFLHTPTGGATSCVETCPKGYFEHTDNSKKKCLPCSDKNNGGIDGCAECTAPTTSGSSSSQKATCTKCASPKYLKADGTCGEASECTGTTFPKADKNAGNKCVACSTAADGGIDDCTECTPIPQASRAGTVAITCSKCGTKKVSPDKSSCVATCPDNSTEKETGTCLCNEGYSPKDGNCELASTGPNLSTGAIAGISVAAVVVVGGLVGFLCWWFICRGKA